MRSVEDKGCYSHGLSPDISGGNSVNFEFHQGGGPNRTPHHRTALGKPTPSKWDDAQKWLVGLSRGGDKNQARPRNSNADDRRLIAPVPQKEEDWEDEILCPANGFPAPGLNQYEVETKKVDCENQSIWRINKPIQNSMASGVRSVSVRDMGTEMTPITSQEPSRTGTPIKVRTPAARSPMSSGSSTPARYQHGLQEPEDYQAGSPLPESRREVGPASRGNGGTRRYVEDANVSIVNENKDSNQLTKPSPLETRAMAWDEAERAKYMARYKREEVRIQAWENHQKRKAEMEMRKMEVKAERLKARAQERLANKLAMTKRIAEEKRANAEAKLNEKAVSTTERADYIRRTGHLPSSFSFKLPSLCR